MVTSRPRADPDSAVNVGVAARITADSCLRPRYDPSLTPAERGATSNGIWLCQTYAKLIDSDVAWYTVGVLRQLKTRAESAVAAMLPAGTGQAEGRIPLVIPSVESPDALLSVASQRLTRVGRDTELAELDAFLGPNPAFAWWLWTGPAGARKSRLVSVSGLLMSKREGADLRRCWGSLPRPEPSKLLSHRMAGGFLGLPAKRRLLPLA